MELSSLELESLDLTGYCPPADSSTASATRDVLTRHSATVNV